MVGGFDFWGEGLLVGATFPAGAAHGWWGGGKVLAALSLLRRASYFLLRLCTTSPPVCVCSRTYSLSSSLEAFLSTKVGGWATKHVWVLNFPT